MREGLVSADLKERTVSPMKGQAVIPKQGVQLCNSLSLTADFASVDPAVIQELIDDPTGTARKFILWIKNRGNPFFSGPRIIKIDHAHTFNSVEFLGKDRIIWRGPVDGDGLDGEEDQDGNALALTEFDLDAVQFEDCLEEGQVMVEGEERLLRLKAKSVVRLDARVFQALWENREIIPDSWKVDAAGKTRFIYFDGTIFRHPCGSRFVLCLYFVNGRWGYCSHWLNRRFLSNDSSAVLASK